MTTIAAPKFHPDMEKELLLGKKRCTSRSKKLGDVGDTFELKGQTFVFTRVEEIPFGQIAYEYYRCEGFFSPVDFQSFWQRIHRGHLPGSRDMKWLHVIARAG